MHGLLLGALVGVAAGANVTPFAGVGAGPGISLDGGPLSYQMLVRGGVHLPLQDDRLGIALFLPVRLMVSTDERETSLFNVGLVPTARGTFTLTPKLYAYLDLGVGVAFFRWTTGNSIVGDVRSNATTAEIDFGAGLEYRVHEQLALFLEPVGFRIFSAGSGTTEVGRFKLDYEQDPLAVWALLAGAHLAF